MLCRGTEEENINPGLKCSLSHSSSIMALSPHCSNSWCCESNGRKSYSLSHFLNRSLSRRWLCSVFSFRKLYVTTEPKCDRDQPSLKVENFLEKNVLEQTWNFARISHVLKLLSLSEKSDWKSTIWTIERRRRRHSTWQHPKARTKCEIVEINPKNLLVAILKTSCVYRIDLST